jgi:hypothetical protein
MKLSEHVDRIRGLTQKSFSNYFARLGITAKKAVEIEKLPEEVKSKREKVDRVIKNHLEETGSFAAAVEKTLDEYTFTLFNRIAAVKVMEAHRMFPEVITKRPENGNKSFSHRAWIENNKDIAGEELEGIRQFIKFEFNRLGEEIPLYHKDYPYALLPYVIELNEIIDAFNAVEKDPGIDDDIWQSDDILGWLYESYNNAKKQEHKVSKKKTEYDKVSLQSQVYTPRWVVKFLVDNSLGKLYLEMYPDSVIKNKYKIANVPETRVREVKPLPEITIIDPAVGSGNFLFYAFDLLYDLYMDQIDNYGADYDEDEIPKLIIENNLHGIDIDNRAVQIAQLGLYIKAMRKKRDIHIEKFNVVSSDFVLPDYEDVQEIFKQEYFDKDVDELIRGVWSDLRSAYKFGSLVKIEERANLKLNQIKEQAKKTSFGLEKQLKKWENWKETIIPQIFKAVDESSVKTGDTFLGVKTKEALTYLSILNSKYDLAACNPPYTDSADFGPELRRFVETNYKKPYKFHTNLYASFIKRCAELITVCGKIAMIHPLTFMYIKSFEDVRKYILNKLHINCLIELGLGGVFQNSKVQVDVAAYILEDSNFNVKSYFMNLQPFKNHTNKPEIFNKSYLNFINKIEDKNNFLIPQSKLKIIKSWPFIYWISDVFREKFEMETITDYADVGLGLKTANNFRYLRFWWEINNKDVSIDLGDNKKWINYLKGGEYNQWYGNEWLVIDWEDNGKRIRKQKNSQLIERGMEFRDGVTISTRSAKGVCGRLFNENSLFDMAASSILPSNKEELFDWLGYSNSKLFVNVQGVPLVISGNPQ